MEEILGGGRDGGNIRWGERWRKYQVGEEMLGKGEMEVCECVLASVCMCVWWA